jgi:hypothetical protein
MDTFHTWPLLIVGLFGLPVLITLLCRYAVTDAWNVPMPWNDALKVGGWVVCFMFVLAFVVISAQLLTNVFGVFAGILFAAAAVVISVWVEYVIFQRCRLSR